MKRTIGVGVAVLAGMLWFVVGCSDKDEKPYTEEPYLGNVIIQMSADTVDCWQGDTVSVDGFVLVTDGYGAVLPGAKITFWLSESFGVIEFPDTSLRDTTDTLGRVDFRFILIGAAPATQIITATVWSRSTQWQLVFGQSVGMLEARIYLEPAVIHLGFGDSCRVTIRVTDADNNPPRCFGFNLPVNISGGEIESFPAVDSSGTTRSWWQLPHIPGTYYVYALQDTARVVVDSLQ